MANLKKENGIRGKIPDEQIPYVPKSKEKVWNYNSSQGKNKYNEEAFPFNQKWITEWQNQKGMVMFTQETVEKDPKAFIAEEEIPACEELWNKNIYTRMSGLPYEDGNSWIEIYLAQLSDENKKIARRIGDIKSRGKDRCIIRTEHVGKNGQLKLLELAKKFEMQDVPCSYSFEIDQTNKTLVCTGGYVTAEQFLELVSNNSSRSIVLEDIGQIAKEYGAIYDEETKRIYCSQFHYDKHQNYEEYLKSKKHLITPRAIAEADMEQKLIPEEIAKAKGFLSRLRELLKKGQGER